MARGRTPSQPMERAKTRAGRANHTRTLAKQIAEAFCKTIGLDFNEDVFIGPTKTIERILQKAKTQHGGNIESVSDGCRLMIVFNDAALVEEITDMLHLALERRRRSGNHRNEFEQALNRNDFDIEFKDYFKKPKRWGYMGFVLKISPKGGKKHIPFEIQITHRTLFEKYYPSTHTLYESIRENIEHYESAGTPLKNWDKFTRDKLSIMLQLHRDGATESGVENYIGKILDIDDLSDPDESEQDITPVEYEGIGLG